MELYNNYTIQKVPKNIQGNMSDFYLPSQFFFSEAPILCVSFQR